MGNRASHGHGRPRRSISSAAATATASILLLSSLSISRAQEVSPLPAPTAAATAVAEEIGSLIRQKHGNLRKAGAQEAQEEKEEKASAEIGTFWEPEPVSLASEIPALRGGPQGNEHAAVGGQIIDDPRRRFQEVTSDAATWNLCETVADKEACLLRVDAFLDERPRTVAFGNGGQLIQTFGRALPGGGGPCGPLCELLEGCVTGTCRFDVYDNAVAAIYYTKRNKIAEARKILDAFTALLYASPEMHLLAAAYGADGLPIDTGIDTGNNAWAALAYGHFAAATNEPCMAAIGRTMMHKIADETGCDDYLMGFMARMPRGVGTYRVTEHNIDMFALAKIFGDQGLQDRASIFVSRMFAFDPDYPQAYATSTNGGGICSTAVRPNLAVAADAQFWNLLSNADADPIRKRYSLEFALRSSSEGGFIEHDKDVLGDGKTLSGLRFTDRGYGAQWENTASAVMGVGMYDALYAIQAGSDLKSQTPGVLSMKNSLLHLLEEYGSVLGSVRGGNFQAYYTGSPVPYPGGSDTGIGWTYLRYPHSAATAWTGLMLLEANPFAHPLQPMPSAAPDGLCPAR